MEPTVREMVQSERIDIPLRKVIGSRRTASIGISSRRKKREESHMYVRKFHVTSSIVPDVAMHKVLHQFPAARKLYFLRNIINPASSLPQKMVPCDGHF